MESIAITLPCGYATDGTRHRTARLRPLTGADELFFGEVSSLTPARRTTALLARTLAISDEAARTLTAGDRESVLLQLRRATFGDELASVLTCPRDGCGETMDLTLRIAELLVGDDERPPVHETEIGGRVVRFRVPNGGDLEAAAPLALDDPHAAARHVLARCIESIDGAAAHTIPEEVVRELPTRMAELDPQAEMLLALVCTRCGLPFSAVFDAAAFLFGELAAQRRALFREVHELALRYHWSESEILALPVSRRRVYLELLAEEAR
jgi:hypothetical protein